MPLSATEAISPAMEHARKQLFHPFRLGQWARLAVVGFLTAEISSGGSCNFSTHLPGPHKGGSANPPQVEAVLHKLSAFWHTNMALIAGLIAGLIIFFFLLGILFTYLNSRMRFALFDSIIAKECRIREYWSRRGEPARKFFIWQLLFGLCSLMAFVILIGIPVGIAWSIGWLRRPGDHILPLVLGGMVVFFMFVALATCTNLIQVLAKDFVVPHMAVENLTVIEGWRRVWAAIKAEKGAYAGYIGMKILLAIAAGIIFTIVGVIVFVIVLIPLFIAGVIAGVIGAGAGLTWNALTITVAIVAGSIAVLFLIYLTAFISVPVVVFFPAYSIHFLASRYPKLDALLHPAPTAPSSAPPTVAPPQIPPPFLPQARDPMGS